MRTLLLDTLQGKSSSSHPPIWLMRQAGRYMPTYRALRERHSILEMFRNPELIVQTTELPFAVADFDAAILFADILLLLDCFGIDWQIKPGVGPVIAEPIRRAEQIDRLCRRPAEEALPFWRPAIQELLSRLDVPLLGFCGGPLTLVSYMVEGESSRDLTTVRKWMVRDPKSFDRLMGIVTDAAIDLLRLQVDAGVHAVQIFDSWAPMIPPHIYREQCLPHMRRLRASLSVPVILFSRGSASHAPLLAELEPEGLGIDWSCDLTSMRKRLGSKIVLQGNFDPHLLFGEPQLVRSEAKRLLREMRKDSRYIFNLGHGVLPETPLENVQELVATVQELR